MSIQGHQINTLNNRVTKKMTKQADIPHGISFVNVSLIFAVKSYK